MMPQETIFTFEQSFFLYIHLQYSDLCTHNQEGEQEGM